MNNAPTTELPSAQRLLRSTVIAAATAAVLLVTAVLPAEYGVDPTGVGRVLGLTEMGEIKMQLAKEAAAADAAEAAAGSGVAGTVAAAPAQPSAPTTAQPTTSAAGTAPVTAPDLAGKVDAIHIVLRPSESKEVKLVMRKGARVQYAWSTDRGAVNFETHGDTLNAPPGVFHSYSKGRNARAHEGAFVAVFDGMHGWFWRNRSREAVTITLRTEGEYQEVKRMD